MTYHWITVVIVLAGLQFIRNAATVAPYAEVKRFPLTYATRNNQTLLELFKLRAANRTRTLSFLASVTDQSNNQSSSLSPNITLGRPTKLPRKSVIGGQPLASYYTTSAWINTIKSIAVCWAIVACIWIFFKLLTCSTFAYRIWHRKRLAESHEMALLGPEMPGNPRGCPVLGLGFTTRWTQVNLLKNDAATEAPPEYAQFSPPAYEEVIGFERCAELVLEHEEGGSAQEGTEETAGMLRSNAPTDQLSL